MNRNSPLALIDEIVGNLSRDGPGAGARPVAIRRRLVTPFCLHRETEEGCIRRLLAAVPLPSSCSLSQIVFRLASPSEEDGPHDGLHALMLARASLEAIYDHLGKKIYQHDAHTQLSAYRVMATWPVKDFVKCAKFWITYPMARGLRGESKAPLTDLPPPPPRCYSDRPFDPSKGPGFGQALLYSGSLRRCLKARIVSFSGKNLRLLMTLLQGVKRGAAVVPSSFIHETMLKHRQALTRPVSYTWEMETDFEDHIRIFYRGCRPYHREIFEASSSASFDATRSQGGAREFLRQSLRRDHVSYPGRPDLLTMFEKRPGVVAELRGFDSPSLSEMDYRLDLGLSPLREEAALFQVPLGRVPKSTPWMGKVLNLSSSIERSLGPPAPLIVEPVSDLPDPGLFRPLEAITLPQRYWPPDSRLLKSAVGVSAVLEPLKVRLVTKGESVKYWMSRAFQKHLWHDLQRHRQFIATSRPLDKSDLYSILDREKAIGSFVRKKYGVSLNFDLWVSGDYSAASDSVKIGYTIRSLEAAMSASRVDPDHRDLMRSVLYQQEIHYPAKENIPPAQQTTGQLMGSTLSFPILCAINLLGYWMALERYIQSLLPWPYCNQRVQLPLLLLAVLVNGDDILFRANPAFYQIWKGVITELGFEFSQGKNYVHPYFLTINSQGYLFRGGIFTDVPFLNIGLLTGQSKVSGRVSTQIKPIWDLYNEVMRGAQDRARTHRRFLHYHRDDVARLTNRGEYNLFIHPLFGGLGFKLYPEVAVNVTFSPFQLRFGGFLRDLSRTALDGVEFRKLPLWRGIVSAAKKTGSLVVSPYKRGSYRSRDRFCPLQEGETIAASQDIPVGGPLVEDKVFGSDRPEFVVHPPDRATLRAFRSRHTPAFQPKQLLENHRHLVKIPLYQLEEKQRVASFLMDETFLALPPDGA